MSIVVHSFRRGDCDTNHYLVVTKVRERFAVCKEEAQRFVVGKFNFRKMRWRLGNSLRLK